MKDLKRIRKRRAHAFDWLTTLYKEELEGLKLVKGVALSEGELKSGEVMTRDNVIAGAGGMRAAAVMGEAQLDIDHYEDKLPEEYEKKYDAAINDPYPPGFIIDAQAVENEIDGKKLMQVEYIAVILNDYVYNLIKDHKIKGNSVVDYPRTLNCKTCEEEGHECNCEYEGSAYLANTLILDEVPNSNSTWVDVMTVEESDAAAEKLSKSRHNYSRLAKKIHAVLHKEHEHVEGDLDDYMTDGIWNDGEASISQYLMGEKEIEESMARAMATYLFANPTNLSQYQLENLSTDDLVAWWNTFALLDIKMQGFKKQMAKLKIINAADLATMNNFVPFGQGEVNYGEKGEGMNCGSCRWYGGYNEGDAEELGYCAIVAGEVGTMHGCDKHEALPTANDNHPEEEEPDMPDDEEPMADDEMEPDENGECPEGYMLNEAGTMCIKVEGGDGDDDMGEMKNGKQPAPVPEAKPHAKPTGKPHMHSAARIEKKPEQPVKDQAKTLFTEITRLNEKRKLLTKQLERMPRFSKTRQHRDLADELDTLTAEINRLELLKKKQ